jgi:hypothetical protein
MQINSQCCDVFFTMTSFFGLFLQTDERRPFHFTLIRRLERVVTAIIAAEEESTLYRAAVIEIVAYDN